MNSTLNTTQSKNMIAIPIPDAAVPLPQTNETVSPAIGKAVKRAFSNFAVMTARTLLQPKKILKVGRVTVVFWEDGSSTAVKCGENEIPDDYVAFCAALGKKVFGTNTALKRAFMDAPHETKEP